jgi:hypothetical protein
MLRGRLLETESDRFITARSTERENQIEKYKISDPVRKYLIIYRNN